MLRDPSATLTIGGGQVLQPVARKVRRRHFDTLVRIEQLWTGSVEERALTVAWFAGYAGTKPADLVRGAGIPPDQATTLLAQLEERGDLVAVAVGSGKRLLLPGDLVGELDERILTTLGRLHEQSPLLTTHDRQKLQAQLDYIGEDALIQAAVDKLIGEKKLVGDARRVARADFKPKLSANLRKLKDRMVAAYQEGGFQPPEPTSFAGQAGGNAAKLKDLLEVCVAEGHLVPIDSDIYLHTEAEAELRTRVVDRLSDGSGLTVAEIRDLLGTTRKYAVPFCEYLDRIGVTQRAGDLRVRGEAS